MAKRRETPLFIHAAERYPTDPRAVFILALSVFSGVGSLAAEAAPESLEAVVPQWGVIMWGIGLSLGSALALFGLWRDSVTGIILEQIGSVAVGVACVFYGSVALWVVGGGTAQPVGIIFAWGVACLIRWLQLQLLLVKMHHKKLRAEAQLLAQSIIEAHRTEEP